VPSAASEGTSNAPSEAGNLPFIRAATNEAVKANRQETSSEAVVLQVKWPVGGRYIFRVDMLQDSTNHIGKMPPIRQSFTTALTYALTVVQELPESGRELEIEFLANEMEIKMADQVVVSFDSKESAEGEEQNFMIGPFRKMIGSKVRVQTDAKGKLEKILNLEEWRQALAGDQPGPMAGMLAQFFNETFFRQIVDFGTGLPEKPVRIGDTWEHQDQFAAGTGQIDVNANLTFTDWEVRQQRKSAKLSTIGTMTGEVSPPGSPKLTIEDGKLTGTAWFDPELGTLVETVINQTMRMKGNLPKGMQGMEGDVTVEMAQQISLFLAEVGKVDANPQATE
jgi:hypothetical protein